MRARGRDDIETKLLSLDMIEQDDTIFPRLHPPDRKIVQAIRWSIRNGISPPPILVYRVNDRHILVDGRNRIEASAAAGETAIMAEIRRGTLEEAAYAAAGANARPAQARHKDEVRLAVTLALRSSPETSDERLAEHVGCSKAIVRDLRRLTKHG
jgi:ParB-like chromosome segregation protein Spo0J